MTDAELEGRVEALRERIEAAVRELNAPALVIYSAMGWDGPEVSVRGGECVFSDDATRPVMMRIGERITLLGYAWSRLEVLKREGAAECGPRFSLALQRELQGNVESMDPSRPPGFATSLDDLVRCYVPAIAVGSTVPPASPGAGQPARETGACAALDGRSADDAAAALGAVTRRLAQLVTDTARSLGIPPERFRRMVDTAAAF